METYRGRRPTTMPSLAQLRARINQLEDENARLRAGAPVSNSDEVDRLQSELVDARDRADAAEARAQDLLSELEAARRASNRAVDSGISKEASGADDSAGDAKTRSYADMTASQLREMLADRGLPTSGSKPDLIARLENTQ